MVVTEIEIENFGPYFGKHPLDLGVSQDAPVILVHGDNMRGKTSLLNAIRWVLYGHALDRRNQPKPSHAFLSYDARDTGEYFMRVRLRFSHEGADWELQRHVQWEHNPTSDSDLREELSLQRDGRFIPRQDVPETIAEIMHEDISRFFLFDAEMLGQYEVLLGEPGRDAELVKSSIEQILGVPALQLATSDLRELEREAEERHLRLARAADRNRNLTDQAAALKEARDAVEHDIERLTTEHAKASAERNVLADELEGFSDVQEDMRAFDRIETEIGELTREQNEERERIVSLIRSQWWLPATRSLAGREAEVSNEIAKLAMKQGQLVTLDHDEQQINKALNAERCSACGHTVGDDERKTLTDRLEEIRKRRADAQKDGLSGRLTELTVQQENLRQFAATEELGRLTEQDRSWREQRIKINRKKREAERIRTRLREHPREAIRSTEVRHEKAIRAMQALENDLSARRADLATKQAEYEKVQRKIARLPDADPRAALEFEVYPALTKVFDEGVEAFRRWLREEVERAASEVFLGLTTEEDYTSLRINQQYGLQIVATGDQVIAERSAGAEQVVALSLIAGLNKCTGKDAPVVMDTPFGRLDKRHGKNILEFLPTLAAQVILLVQPREFDRDRDLRYLGGRVAREYRIVRDGSPTRSRIEAL